MTPIIFAFFIIGIVTTSIIGVYIIWFFYFKFCMFVSNLIKVKLKSNSFKNVSNKRSNSRKNGSN